MKLEKLSGETRLYPIIGNPISFVKSPHCLTAKFEELDHNGICVPMLLEVPQQLVVWFESPDRGARPEHEPTYPRPELRRYDQGRSVDTSHTESGAR